MIVAEARSRARLAVVLVVVVLVLLFEVWRTLLHHHRATALRFSNVAVKDWMDRAVRATHVSCTACLCWCRCAQLLLVVTGSAALT